jgi:hypothetical protein
LGGYIEARLVSVSLTPCYVTVRFAACVTASAGQIRAEGGGLQGATHDYSLYAALGARLELKQRLTERLGLFLSADATKNLSPITFRLHGETVWSSPTVAAVTALGVEITIP